MKTRITTKQVIDKLLSTDTSDLDKYRWWVLCARASSELYLYVVCNPGVSSELRRIVGLRLTRHPEYWNTPPYYLTHELVDEHFTSFLGEGI